MGRLDVSRGSVVVPLLLAATIACSKAPPPAATAREGTPAPAGAPTGDPATVVIEVRPITISFRGSPIARLHADGRTESAGDNAPGTALVPGPTLHADGTITLTRLGATARLDAQGDLYVIGPPGATPREQLFGHLTHDQFTFAGSSNAWDVRVRGNLIEFGERNSSQIDGAITPAIQHTALVMAAAFYLEGALTSP